jgi:hypothetical protein
MIDKRAEITSSKINHFPVQANNVYLGFGSESISWSSRLLLLSEHDST